MYRTLHLVYFRSHLGEVGGGGWGEGVLSGLWHPCPTMTPSHPTRLDAQLLHMSVTYKNVMLNCDRNVG